MTDAKPPLPPEELDEPVVANDDETPQEPAGEAPQEPPKPTPPRPSDPPPPPAAPPAAAPHSVTYVPRDPMAKSPGLALFLAIFFPGLGHIYAGSYERALMIIGGIAVSVWGIVHSEGRLWLLAFAIAFGYFFSIFDAYREAQIANLSADEELPERRGSGEGRLLFGVFLVVVAALVLADNLGLLDIRWIYDWWPLLILVIGAYFIGSWIWDRMKASTPPRDPDLD